MAEQTGLITLQAEIVTLKRQSQKTPHSGMTKTTEEDKKPRGKRSQKSKGARRQMGMEEGASETQRINQISTKAKSSLD